MTVSSRFQITEKQIRKLPEPLCSERFELLKNGIYNDININVFVNELRDFAMLSPEPSAGYINYLPRHKALNLTRYKAKQCVIKSRFEKLQSILPSLFKVDTLMEIGAADGEFLSLIRNTDKDIKLFSVDPDQSTQTERTSIDNVTDFSCVEEAMSAGVVCDVVCLFHVFEHIASPAVWLEAIKKLLRPKGHLVLEVPSLTDPLLSLYRVPAYEDYYFQHQHPFVYSGTSMSRVLEYYGFKSQIYPYQRYGIENHLTWLSDGKPGGSEVFHRIFAGIEKKYINALESVGVTDSVIAIARRQT